MSLRAAETEDIAPALPNLKISEMGLVVVEPSSGLFRVRPRETDAAMRDQFDDDADKEKPRRADRRGQGEGRNNAQSRPMNRM
jgi:hypothetical protein